jgi:hypothetical protein
MQTRTPHKITPSVLQFCSSIIQNQTPFYVPIDALPHYKLNECFNILPQHIISYGGKQIFGWSIWEWPRVMIEAEFHTVWQADNGRIIDVTPKEVGFTQILFLPDPRRKYEGCQVNNIRKALTGDKRIRRYIQVADELFFATNEGDLAYKNEFVLTPRIMKIRNEMEQLYHVLIRKYS